MTRRASIVATVLLSLSVLLLLGVWVGAFETFGGYVPRQRAFLWTSLAIGLAVAVLLNRRWKVRVVVAGTFALLSYVTYVLGQALGQTYYVGTTNAEEFMRTFWAALNGQL